MYGLHHLLYPAGSHWGAVYAVLVAILGPAIPAVAWLLVTYSYRQDKLMIIKQVGKHVSEAELGTGAGDTAIESQPGGSSSRSVSTQGSGVSEALSPYLVYHHTHVC